MPRRLLSSVRIRWAALIFVCYWLLSLATVPVELAQMLRPVLICVVMGVILKYTPDAWRGVVTNDLGAVSQLAQGIWLAFFGLFCGLVWSTAANLLPNSQWMRESPVVGFYYLCYIVAGTLHMTARRNPDGRIRAEDVRDVFVAYSLGLMISLSIVGFQVAGLLKPTV